MKRITELVIALGLGLSAVASPVLAQERHDDQGTRRENRGDEMRQSRESARREAIAAYAQAKRDCGRERRNERAHCLRAAKEDYDHQIADSRRR